MPLPGAGLNLPDSVQAWAAQYLDLAIRGVRSAEVTDKIATHLARFGDYLAGCYGHERLSVVVARDVAGWRDHLADPEGERGWRLRRSTRTWRRYPGFSPGSARTPPRRCRMGTPPAA